VKTSRFPGSHAFTILKQAKAWSPVPERCREYGIISGTFYERRTKFGAMDSLLMAHCVSWRRKTVASRRCPPMSAGRQKSPRRRWKIVVKPSLRREMAQQAVHFARISNAWACLAFGVSLTCYRNQTRLSSENAEISVHLIWRMFKQCKWGFGLCFLCLRNVKGNRWNHKWVCRAYREGDRPAPHTASTHRGG
jgi:putative transposase